MWPSRVSEMFWRTLQKDWGFWDIPRSVLSRLTYPSRIVMGVSFFVSFGDIPQAPQVSLGGLWDLSESLPWKHGTHQNRFNRYVGGIRVYVSECSVVCLCLLFRLPAFCETVWLSVCSKLTLGWWVWSHWRRMSPHRRVDIFHGGTICCCTMHVSLCIDVRWTRHHDVRSKSVPDVLSL